MENFAPGLREGVLSLTDALRVVVYFVCVAGLVIQIQQARADTEGLTRPIVRAAIVVGLVATLPFWFGFTERVFLCVADTVQDGYTQHPMRAASKLRETVSSNSEFSLRRIGESLYRAFLDGSVKLVVLDREPAASAAPDPTVRLKLLCYLFLPVALAFYMIPSQAQLATRYVQQTLGHPGLAGRVRRDGARRLSPAHRLREQPRRRLRPDAREKSTPPPSAACSAGWSARCG
jgi:hypothetical protein